MRGRGAWRGSAELYIIDKGEYTHTQHMQLNGGGGGHKWLLCESDGGGGLSHCGLNLSLPALKTLLSCMACWFQDVTVYAKSYQLSR